MRIVDSQVHIWDHPTPARPWPTGDRYRPHRPVPFSAADALAEMDVAGVHAMVVVPPWWAGEHNDCALQAVQARPGRFAVMGLLDFRASQMAAQLAIWRRQPGMLGLRFSSQDPKYKGALGDGSIDGLWAAAERSNVPLMMSVAPGELDIVSRIAKRHPGLRLAIDHLARDFGKKGPEAFSHLDSLLAMARLPNVAVKASGMPAYALDAYPFHSMHSYVRRAYDAFGPQRMFWGSDCTKLPCSYAQAVTMFTQEMPWLSTSDKEWIMGRGMCEWLSWTAPIESSEVGRIPKT